MGVVVKYDMILDMLCGFDTLAGDAFCVAYHKALYERFGKGLGARGCEALDILRSELGEVKVGQSLVCMLGESQDFQMKTMRECFERERMTKGEKRLADAVMTLSEVLIEKGFHTYWLEEVLPGLEARTRLLEGHLSSTRGIWQYLDAVEPQEEQDTVLWLCGCSMPHRFQFAPHQYIGDTGIIDAYLMGNEEAIFPSQYESFEDFLEQIPWESACEALLYEA
ncbi:MAG: hypothetical protein ACRCW2_16275 [Cellulosilyticaceae bacterium]